MECSDDRQYDQKHHFVDCNLIFQIEFGVAMDMLPIYVAIDPLRTCNKLEVEKFSIEFCRVFFAVN